jgi:branched-chain amino acid transport system ATP-binding protein
LKIRQGLAFVPQTENVFPLMTVAENLAVSGGILPRGEVAARIDEMFQEFPDLARQRALMAGSLSGGQRQMLAVARALLVRPRVLMLDEPSAGLSPKLVSQVFAGLQEIRSKGLTIVLVEQNARAALAIGDRAYVLVEGREAHEGPAKTLWDNPLIAELYLGHRRQES